MTPIQRFFGRITEFFSLTSNDIIARVRTYTRRWKSSFRNPTHDWGRADYNYYRRLYYGRVTGLELSGLLVKPIVSKLSAWTLGRAPRWKLDSETSQQALTDWWADAHPEVLRAWRGALKQADSFVVVNSDLSLTLLPPDSVDPIVAEDDYANVIGWRVTQVLAHPETTARMTVIDEYYADKRIHRVEVNGIRTQETTYPNLLGRIQLVHIANQVDTGETFGHAEAEGLLPLLHRYGEVMDAAVEGNITQGRPTPVITFEEKPDLEDFWARYGTNETRTLPDGTTETTPTLNIDVTQTLTIAGGEFDYKAPGNFTADTAQLLEIMFYLFGQHSEIPEFILGMAVASSKASTDSQMPVFIEFIKMRRGDMVAWLTAIAEIALGYLALITPGVSVATPMLQWEALDQQDGALTLETIKWAFAEGLLTELTALKLMPVEVEDPEGELRQAKVEREERQERAMQQMEQQAQIAADNAPQTPVNEMTAYRDVETEGIVGAAVKILTEGVYANGNGHA